MKLFNKFSSKGFTLIELLVVIAVLGVMAAAIVAAINPLAKINQAKDSNIKSDLSTIANALQAYYTGGGATPAYPANLNALTTNELKALPTSATWVYSTTAAGGAVVYATLNVTSAGAVWCWKNDGSAPAAMAAASCTTP
jgi:prepilin-type N-terminal cleavage/methylation domain-containing protein